MSLTGRERRKSLVLISEINVAAFAAIMVVLFAMFALPGMWAFFEPQTGRVVDWPPMPHARSMRGADRTDAIWVTVQRTGDVWLGDKKLPLLSQLPDGIRRRLDQGSERKIYIIADARARHGRVQEVLAVIHKSGVEHVAFLAVEGKA